jgi:hypothetical protein
VSDCFALLRLCLWIFRISSRCLRNWRILQNAISPWKDLRRKHCYCPIAELLVIKQHTHTDTNKQGKFFSSSSSFDEDFYFDDESLVLSVFFALNDSVC